ncbi:hypothetical protein Tco_1291112 [Tanacetum coccineum]
MFIGVGMLTFRFLNKHSSQVSSQVQYARALYSASVKDLETTGELCDSVVGIDWVGVEGCVSGGLVNDAMGLEEFFECGVDKLCPIVTSYGFDICFEVILNITVKGLDMGDRVVFTGHEVRVMDIWSDAPLSMIQVLLRFETNDAMNLGIVMLVEEKIP